MVSKCGWAGPLLWINTLDDYAIHLCDEKITLNNNEVTIGTDINNILSGSTITEIKVDKSTFIVKFNTDIELQIPSAQHETARIFNNKSNEPHCVYEEGTINCD